MTPQKFDISRQHPDILDKIELIGVRHKKSVKFKEDLLKYRKKNNLNYFVLLW